MRGQKNIWLLSEKQMLLLSDTNVKRPVYDELTFFAYANYATGRLTKIHKNQKEYSLFMLDKALLNQLYRFAVSLSHNEDQAYDLLQSCVEKYLKADRDKIEKPAAYMMRLIRNEFIDQVRRQRFSYDADAETLERISDEAALDEMSVEDIYIQRCEVEALLNTMRPDERELLFLWAVEEYTIDEISQLQQVPRGTLLSKLHRLKRRIRLQQTSENVLNLRVKS